MSKPDMERVPAFYHNYIKQVEATNLQQALHQHEAETVPFLQSIPADKWMFRYAEGKWTIKELVQHIIDAERIFNYRALCFSRKDEMALPGFDEDLYVTHSEANKRSQEELLQELKIVQQSSILLFGSFSEAQLEASGVANGNPIYVKAIGFIIAGHTLHHLRIIRERYL